MLKKAFAASKSMSIWSVGVKKDTEEIVKLDQFDAEYLGEW